MHAIVYYYFSLNRMIIFVLSFAFLRIGVELYRKLDSYYCRWLVFSSVSKIQHASRWYCCCNVKQIQRHSSCDAFVVHSTINVRIIKMIFRLLILKQTEIPEGRIDDGDPCTLFTCEQLFSKIPDKFIGLVRRKYVFLCCTTFWMQVFFFQERNKMYRITYGASLAIVWFVGGCCCTRTRRIIFFLH